MATADSTGPSRWWDDHRWVGRWTIIGAIAAVAAVLIMLATCGANFTGGGEATPPPTTIPSSPPAGPTDTDEPAPPSDPPSEPPTVTPRTPASLLLADLEPVGGVSIGTEEVKGVEISGQSYPRTLVQFCENFESTLEYNLGRRWETFVVTIGIDDTQPSEYPVDLTIHGDGQLLESMTLQLGEPRDVRIPVRGVLRLELACQTRTSEPSAFAWSAVSYGDGKLLP